MRSSKESSERSLPSAAGGAPGAPRQARNSSERLVGVQEQTGPAVRKVLILSLSGIGNFIMQSPTLAALKRAHPTWHITAWVAPRGTAALAKNSPYIDEVIEAPIKHTLLGHSKMVSRLHAAHYDIGIVLSPGQLIKSAAYLWLAGIPKRLGYTYPLFGRTTSMLLTDSIPEDPAIHDVEQNLNLLKLIAVSTPLQPITYSLTLPLKFHKRAEELMAKLNIPTSKRLLGLHPGSAPGFEWKRWPLKHFKQVAEHYANHNYHILVFGGREEARLKNKLCQWVGKDATPIEADLLTTAAIMQHCQVYISNDSGLMHLAAAVGIPTLGLFGPTDERQTGPRGKQSAALRAPGTQPVYNTEKNFALGSGPHATLKALDPSYVLEAAERFR